MKKICFITTVPGTIKAFILRTAEYLHQNGEYDISFICNFDNDFAQALPEYIHFIPVHMERGMDITGIKAIFDMKKIFEREKFDLIQFSTPNASLYASVAGKLAKVPVRLYCQWGIVYVGFSGFKRKIFKLIEKLVCALSTWIEPDSFGNLEFSHNEGLYSKNKSSVIWNGSASGVSLQKFDISHKDEWRKKIRNELSIPSNAKVFVFVGRVTRDKGIDELFSATKKLFEMHQDAYLLMVGSNENPKSLNQPLYHWSIDEKRVIYVGRTKAVETYLSASDVYVLPSYREGFGSAVVEAEAMGLPVIVSNIPGPTDAMKNEVTGILVEKGNSEDLFNAMNKLYLDTDLRSLLGQNAHEFAKERFEQRQLFAKILEDRNNLISGIR